MSNTAQQFPITPAVAVNGNFSRKPFLWDLNVNNIGVIIPTVYVDPGDRQRKNGYEMTYWNEKTIAYDTILWPASNFASLDVFIAYVNSVVADASEVLVKYVNFIRRDQWKPISPVVDIVVNSRKLNERYYNAPKNETDLYVNLGNTIEYAVFTVRGDQTLAGPYYYTGSL